jgi:hypothetical protein
MPLVARGVSAEQHEGGISVKRDSCAVLRAVLFHRATRGDNHAYLAMHDCIWIARSPPASCAFAAGRRPQRSRAIPSGDEELRRPTRSVCPPKRHRATRDGDEALDITCRELRAADRASPPQGVTSGAPACRTKGRKRRHPGRFGAACSEDDLPAGCATMRETAARSTPPATPRPRRRSSRRRALIPSPSPGRAP